MTTKDVSGLAVSPARVVSRGLVAGDVVGERFVIERLADIGGMGAIYRAIDRTNGAPVAVKVMFGQCADATRFTREAEVLAQLDHEGVVRYVDHGISAEGELYLAMEWLDGEDLRSFLARRRLSVDDALAVIRRLAEALAYAHALGVVHRDLKPSNIFLPAGDLSRCKLIDFGLARLVDRTVATRSGAIIGTPAYMSPEQARGLAGIDARTDVFALGAITFECIAGERAFRGETATAVLAKLIFEPPPRLGDHAEHAPLWLAMLVDRMLQRDPSLRPDNAAAVLDALSARSVASSPRAWLSGRGLARMFVVMARTVNDDPGATRSVGLADTVTGDDNDGAVLVNGIHVHVVAGEGEAPDLARQAVHRALRMQRELHCRRIAVATGVGTTDGGVPMGDAIDRVSRLLAGDAADPQAGEIVVDATTAELLRNRYAFRQRGDAHELLDELSGLGHARRLLGQHAPCVGRDRELGMLASLFDECVDETSARAVLVTAPAGAGKSRLCDELVAGVVARTPRLRVIGAQADPMQAGAPLEIVRALVRSGTGLPGAGDGSALERLAAELQVALAPVEARRTANFLGELVGVPAPAADLEVAAARLDQRLMRDQMQRAFEEWLRFETREHPVLLVIDDLHWSDLASAQYLQATLEHLARRRLFVAMFARPEARESFPELARSRSLQELPLPPLGRKACERLVQAVVGRDVGADTLERIYSISGGNAFFAEELIRVVATGDRELPQSLVASLQVRISRLSHDEQQVVRAASVFGDAFASEGVDRLLGLDRGARDILDRLVAVEIVERVAESRLAGSAEYRFRHDLLREACYALLGDADRARAHLLAADWLIETREDRALAIAIHLDRGGDPARAATRYIRAAEQDVRAGSFPSVLVHTRRARELGLAPGELDTVLGLELEAYRWLARSDDVIATARAILDHAPASSALRFQAIPEMHVFAHQGTVEGVIDSARQFAAELLEADPDVAAHAWLVAASRLGVSATLWSVNLGRDIPHEVAALLDRAEHLCDADSALQQIADGWLWEMRAARATIYRPDEYRHGMSQARACFERIGDYRNACAESLYEIGALLTLGALEHAENAARILLARVEELGLVRFQAKTEMYLGFARAWSGDHQGGRTIVRHALTHLVPPTIEFYQIFGNTELAAAELELGNVDAAELAARTGWELGIKYQVADGAGILAQVLVARGRPDDALELLQEPTIRSRMIWFHLASRLSARTMALRAVGRIDEARDSAAEGYAFIERIAATIPDDAGRAGFWRGNRECAVIAALARELGVASNDA